jgi:ankyrin repeat protein
MASLPPRPDLDRLRRQARELQRQDPSRPLSAAQHALARDYGFASWARLKRYVQTARDLSWDSSLSQAVRDDPAAEFCRLACLTYTPDDGPARWARARRILAEHPQLTSSDIWAAAAAGRPADVERLLTRATQRGGPYRWRPLCYLAYSRVEAPASAVLAVARLLLEAGADPNDGFLFDGLPSAFTVLTGVFGAGEQGWSAQPPHPHAAALARLLLEAGADPNDAQALYNRMFSADNEHLELLFEYGLGRGDGGPWRARAGEHVDRPAELLRTQLRWAVEHDQPDRVRLLVEHGVDFRSPYTAAGLAWRPGDGRTPVELAWLNGNAAIAAYLMSRGAPRPALDPADELIAAVLRGDDGRRVLAEHPEAAAEARRLRPGLVVWAAAHAPFAVEVLVDLGFDVNALGRADVPVEQEWETALHRSAGEGDVALTRRLLALGADPNVRDRRFDATPLGWARHFDRRATIALLEDVTDDPATESQDPR